MSIEDLAYASRLRMRDYLTPDDLNTEACVKLTATILKEAAEAYVHARRQMLASPGNKELCAHFKTCRAFYRSDYFAALSCGLVDGEAVMKELDKLPSGRMKGGDT